MNFYVNGRSANSPFTGIRGTVYPVMYGKCDFIPVWISHCESVAKQLRFSLDRGAYEPVMASAV